jgi:NADPH:quinone reductase-like Zn-dependent oxidoreductase
MRAIVYSEFGGPEILRLVDIPMPVPKDNEILIRVGATALNPADWHLARGIPFPLRMMQGGLRRPASPRRLGLEVAGTVEAAGRSVSEWTAGDCVFGGCEGSVAEYVTVSADRVVRKPERLTFEQVAGVSVAGLTALQALRDKAEVQRGQKVLINGAAGGIGTFAVQIAKMFGAEVTGVQSTRNLSLVRSLGADHVIDYTRQDFTQGTERYDVIFDNVVNRPLSDLRRVLKPGGTLLPNGGGSTPAEAMRISRILRTLMLKPFINQKITFFVTRPNRSDLQMLADLMQAGTISHVIDRCYLLNETPEAMRHLESGHARGKIVITLTPPGSYAEL